MMALASSANATTTYTYTGPDFTGTTEHIVVTITTTSPLAASKSYLSAASAGASVATLNVVGLSGIRLSLPLRTFQLHTNANGAIDSWDLLGDSGPVGGTAPALSGAYAQAYTINSLVFVPGSDVPGAVGLLTGAYDYDQATQTTYYATCNGAPAGCVLAGNGQPYISNLGEIINPSHTSATWWKVTTASGGTGGSTSTGSTGTGGKPATGYGSGNRATASGSDDASDDSGTPHDSINPVLAGHHHRRESSD